MIQASPALSPVPSPAPLHPTIIRRRRPQFWARPKAYGIPLVPAAEPVWSDWASDLRFFLGCYVAGLVFFLIMLS